MRWVALSMEAASWTMRRHHPARHHLRHAQAFCLLEITTGAGVTYGWCNGWLDTNQGLVGREFSKLSSP